MGIQNNNMQPSKLWTKVFYLGAWKYNIPYIKKEKVCEKKIVPILRTHLLWAELCLSLPQRFIMLKS
jgi:hypothetical protein